MTISSATPRLLFAAFAAALMASAAILPARADEATLPPMPKPLEEMATTKATVPPEQASMEAWGRANPGCAEWTDNCQVCVSGDKPGCSTVGTACVRVAPTCRKTKAEASQPVPTPVPRPATTEAPAQTPPSALPAPAQTTPAPLPASPPAKP